METILFPQAIDEFLFYLQVEKNYSENTLRSYAYDLELFHQFLVNHNRCLKMHEQSSSTSRRFIQEQILKAAHTAATNFVFKIF